MSEPVDDPSSGRWLNPAVLGMGLTSLLADAAYETVSAVLPGFVYALQLPNPSLVLGLVDGVADAVSSFVKLGAGWWSDRLGHRKAIVVFGYALSGSAMGLLFAVAVGWPLILTGRVLAWFGRGIRKPLREAILAEAVPAADRGKAFGFHRAGDTLGAILGPLFGAGLLAWFAPETTADPTASYRTLFLLTLIPGFGSALAFALLVRERRRDANPQIKLWASVRALPRDFRRFLVGIGIFGAGDFAHTMLVLAAISALTPAYGGQAAALGAILYTVRNIFAAAAAYPVGHLSDSYSRRRLLIGGYLLAALDMIGFAGAFFTENATLPVLLILFALAGVYIAVEESLEGAMTADLVPDLAVRGTAYGVMGTVNGLGDFLSSAVVGALWAWPVVSFPGGFLFSAVLMLAGAVVLARVR